MSFFTKKKNDAQDAEFKDVKDMPLESEDEISEDIAQEAPVDMPESEQVLETEALSSSEENVLAEEENTPKQQPLPLEEEAHPEALESGDWEVPNLEEKAVTISETELEFPIGKYNLQKLYREIGEEYCANHAHDPEESLKEKVGIVNTLKKTSENLRDTLNSLCRSPWLFFLFLLLAAEIVVTIANDSSVPSVIICIPTALITIACLIVFVQGLAKKIGKTGLGLLGGILTFYLVIGFIPAVSIFLIGVILRFNGDSGNSTAAIALIVFAIILGLVNWFYWGGLKKTTNSAITIATGGISELKVSFFVMIVSFIKLLASLVSVMSYFIFNASFPMIIKRTVNYVNSALGEDVITDSVTNTVTSFNTSSVYFLAGLVIDVLIMLLVFVLLCHIRGLNKKPEAMNEVEE